MNLDTHNYSNIQLIIFREDVFDRFDSIIKSINEEKIKTDFKYNEILKDLYKDFKLINIIRLINTIACDNEFKKSHNSYKIALNYCNEIMENTIIKNSISKQKID
jgi:hypothetical protein